MMPAAARAANRPSAARSAAARTANAGHMIPVAVGRTAVAVRQIPDSGIVHRLTRGRAWIAVLGILLAGIVALNVATLSFTASSGKMEKQALSLEQQNSALRAGLARQLSTDRVEAAAAGLGMVRPGTDEYTYRAAEAASASQAADRLAGTVVVAPVYEAEAVYEPVAEPVYEPAAEPVYVEPTYVEPTYVEPAVEPVYDPVPAE